MLNVIRRRCIQAMCAALLIAVSSGCAHRKVMVNANTPELKAFYDHVRQYADLHRKLEATLPRLPDKATAEQIKSHQEALTAKLLEARAGARPAEFFSDPVREQIRRSLRPAFTGREGGPTLALLTETGVTGVVVKVNGDYPDSSAVKTIPPNVLTRLPVLPEEVEYRFVGPYLILRDRHASLIIDFMPDAIPTRRG